MSIVDNLIVNNFNEIVIKIDNFNKYYFNNEIDFKTFIIEITIDDC